MYVFVCRFLPLFWLIVVCVCVCVCARARVRACVCASARACWEISFPFMFKEKGGRGVE